MALPEPYELLILAMQLALLTYYTGVLVYVIPIPDYRLKRWAPILVKDGIWIAILISVFSIILNVSDIVAAYSGFTVKEAALFASAIINYVYSTNYFYRILAVLVSVIPGASSSLVYALMFPFFLMQYTVFWAAIILLAIASIVISGKSLIAALGVTLMALPFRLGRNAGASLLAFAIVANAMLPYYPLWFKMLLSMTGLSYGVILHYGDYYNVWGIVSDQYSSYPSSSALLFYNATNGKLVYVYPVEEDGTYYIRPPYYIKAGAYHVYLEYLAVRLPLAPSPLKVPSDLASSYMYTGINYRADFHVQSQNTLFLRPTGILFIPRVCTAYPPKISGNTVQLTCITYYNVSYMVTLLTPEDCKVSIDAAGATVSSILYKFKPWRGVMVLERNVVITPRSSIQYLNIKVDCKEVPRPIISPVINEQDNHAGGGIVLFSMLLALFPLSVFSYLSLMAMIMIAVARLLGATSPRVVFEI